MRSSDQRYFDVQRRKRPAYDYAPLVRALRDARLDPRDTSGLEAIIAESSREFTHVFLATGRTAHDFRQSFRHGAHGANIIECNAIASNAALTAAKLDGYVAMRLSKEQTKNVKLRWAKLRDQDRLLHDPQGKVWIGLLTSWLNAVSEEEVIDRLSSIRDQGERLTAKGDVIGQDAVDRSARELLKHVAGYADRVTDTFPAWSPEKTRREARACAFRARTIFREGCEWHGGVMDAWRKQIEESLVVAEAFIAGEDARAAYFRPDTSGRHCTTAQLVARIDRARDFFRTAGASTACQPGQDQTR